MKSKKQIAVEKFLGGYNCAQSVFFSFCADLGIDENTALRIACGFGSGMGRKEEVCGAVSGGIMVIGSTYGRSENEGRTATEITYSKTRELMERFSEKRGSFICRQLLNGLELTTEEGRKYFQENDLLNKTCSPCVESVVEILEDIL